MLSSSLQFDLRESKESTERSYGVHTTHPQKKRHGHMAGVGLSHATSQQVFEQRDSFAHSGARTHTYTLSLHTLKDSLYSRLHSVILKAREAKVTAT